MLFISMFDCNYIILPDGIGCKYCFNSTKQNLLNLFILLIALLKICHR